MSFWNWLVGQPDCVTFTEASSADIVEQKLESAGTFGQIEGNLTGDVPTQDSHGFWSFLKDLDKGL